jgi:hypothetical protein
MPFILNHPENPPFELGNLSLLGGQAWIKESAEGAIPVSPLQPCRHGVGSLLVAALRVGRNSIGGRSARLPKIKYRRR